MARALITPIFGKGKAMETFLPKIEGDQFNCAAALFIDPYKLACVPNLSDPLVSCDSSYSLSQSTLGFNSCAHLISPSEFNHSISALFPGVIKTWNMGSGKLIGLKILDSEIQQELKDFKHFNQWDDFNIARRQDSDGFASFIKFKVTQTEVQVACAVRHKHTVGNNVYISSDNRLLLEFDKLVIYVHQIITEQGVCTTKSLTMMRNQNPAYPYPLYFTPDFAQYMESTHSKFICFYDLPRSTDKKQFIKKDYVKVSVFNVPPQTELSQDKHSGLFMIEFESSNRIRFVNKHGIEQTVPIDFDLEGRGNLIKERMVDSKGMGLDFFSRFRDVQKQTRHLCKLENTDLIQLKAD